MITFIKANVSSTISTLIDYLVTVILINFFRVDVVMASATGTVCGGVVNFIIGRNWVFDAKEPKVQKQVIRYVLVWIGNLLLNTGGMYVLTKIVEMHYMPAKILVLLVVGFGYNYTLQKKFVFKYN